MNKLNILNLATTDQGGAGIASIAFNDLFTKNGHNSVLVVKESAIRNKNVIVLSAVKRYSFKWFIKKGAERTVRFLRNSKALKLDRKYCFYTQDESEQHVSARKILDAISFTPDVIVLHWITKFLNSETISKLSEITKAKIVWIMMDNAPLTGGCHYQWDCLGYTKDCSNCPAILEDNQKDIAYRNLKLKKKFLPNSLEVIAFSGFDYNRANQSSLFKNRTIHKLLSPIDEQKFIIGDKSESKKNLNIDASKKVLLYGASSLSDQRKGGTFFIEALTIFQNKLVNDSRNLNDYLILVAGNSEENYFKNIDIPVKTLGRLNEAGLVAAYQAADIFVCTSVEDSGPTMINQAMMCGIPVVSFRMGVAEDLIRENETGYIAGLMDANDLAKGMFNLITLKEPDYNVMSLKCRALTLEACGFDNVANRFNDILLQANNINKLNS